VRFSSVFELGGPWRCLRTPNGPAPVPKKGTRGRESEENRQLGPGGRYRKAYAAQLELIRSVSPNDRASINTDVMSSVRTTEGVLPKIAGYRQTIVEQLPQFRIQLFDELENRALALGHAQTVFESAQRPPAILQSLSDGASKAHDIARSDVTTLVHRGLMPSQALSTLNGGNGYRNLAADLFKLSEAFRSNWSNIAGRTSMTLPELDRLENLADQINQALGIREQIPEIQATAARDRQAAYTLFIEANDEVRAAIAYVRRKEDDVDTIMPSLYAGRSAPKKRPVVDEPTKPAPTPTPLPVVTPNTPPVNATPSPVVTPPPAHSPSNGASIATNNESGPFMH